MTLIGLLSSRSLRIGGVLLALLLAFGGWEARAQEKPSLRSVDRPVQISVDPVYQYYDTEDGQTLSEASTHLYASVPIGRQFTVQARAGYAQMSGDGLKSVQGLTDLSGRLMFAQSVRDGSLVLSTTVNAPVGKQELSSSELQTTQLFSRNFYDFRVTSFSRGFSVTPRATWAYPINDRLAVGLGVAYQYQRGFQPNAGLTSDSLYVPGDGMTLNGGVDYKLSQGSALGLDLSFKRYSPDRVGGDRRFDAGTRLSGTVRYLRKSGFTTIRVLARYANWEESEFGYQVGGPERAQVIPSHATLLGSYKTRLSPIVDLKVRVSGHRYDETIIESDQTLFGRLYLSPSVELSDQIEVSPHSTVTYGTYLGLGGGVRLQGRF